MKLILLILLLILSHGYKISWEKGTEKGTDMDGSRPPAIYTAICAIYAVYAGFHGSHPPARATGCAGQYSAAQDRCRATAHGESNLRPDQPAGQDPSHPSPLVLQGSRHLMLSVTCSIPLHWLVSESSH